MSRAAEREIDVTLGTLSGEGAPIVRAKPPAPLTAPERQGATTTYYEQPVLKPPVWKAYIPTYLFVGGVAGGALVLGAAAQLGRRRDVVGPARAIAMAGTAISAGLLIADLGRPARFLNMMRVFRPTSPMNVGTWILSGAGAAAAASVILPRLGSKRGGDLAGAVGGVFGLGLASYTSVLLANTAVPAWQHGAKTLPPLFVASAAASAASALDLVTSAPRAFGNVAKVAELVAATAYERGLPAPVRRHVEGRALFRLSKALTVASVAASLCGFRRASGLLGLGGALAQRFAVTDAGRSSARDPRATFEPQRA